MLLSGQDAAQALTATTNPDTKGCVLSVLCKAKYKPFPSKAQDIFTGSQISRAMQGSIVKAALTGSLPDVKRLLLLLRDINTRDMQVWACVQKGVQELQAVSCELSKALGLSHFLHVYIHVSTASMLPGTSIAD